MASKKNRSSKRKARKAKSPSPSNLRSQTRITASDVTAGAKFGYRLVKSVGSTGVTYVNTNGCKPSNKPATVHTISRAEFVALVNG